MTNASLLLTEKRKESTFTGGMTHAGIEMARQPVRIIKCDDDEEDIWIVESAATGKRHRVDGCDLSPHPDDRMTNVEFVTKMMEWGTGGPLLQAFILNAIEQQAKATVAHTAEELETGFISGKAWRDCALEALGWLAARDEMDKRKS